LIVGVEKKDRVIRFFAACYRRLAARTAISASKRSPQTHTRGARGLLWLVLASLLIGLQLEAGRAAPLPFQSNSTNPTATPTPTITPTWTPSFTPGPATITPVPTTPLPLATTPAPLPTTPAPLPPTDTPTLPAATSSVTPTLPALTDTPTPTAPAPPPTSVVSPTATLPSETRGSAPLPPPLPPPSTDSLLTQAPVLTPTPTAAGAGLFAQTFIQALSFVWLGCGILVILALGAGMFLLLRRRPAE